MIAEIEEDGLGLDGPIVVGDCCAWWLGILDAVEVNLQSPTAQSREKRAESASVD